MPLATRFRKQVNVEGDLWAAVVESTGQPSSFDRMPASADVRIAPASERQSQAS
jgi:hypothetical protein